jgi:hypothetical protein
VQQILGEEQQNGLRAHAVLCQALFYGHISCLLQLIKNITSNSVCILIINLMDMRTRTHLLQLRWQWHDGKPNA